MTGYQPHSPHPSIRIQLTRSEGRWIAYSGDAFATAPNIQTALLGLANALTCVPKTGVQEIAEERDIQLLRYPIERDRKHPDGTLAYNALRALVNYLTEDRNVLKVAVTQCQPELPDWMSALRRRSAKDRLRMAGALIAAELDRLERI